MSASGLHPESRAEAAWRLFALTEAALASSSLDDLAARILPDISILAQVVHRLLEHAELEGQLKQLNTYLTVSSALTQPLDLPEVLEIALYSCMEAVSATEASVLLLDDEKKSFHFCQIEGPAKPVLMGAQFPADKGLAGSVLRSRQSEVINDVRSDPRFYGKVDDDSGFTTRNMISTALVGHRTDNSK